VTAGGLIFISAATDDLIKAIDIKSGDICGATCSPRRPGHADRLRAGCKEYCSSWRRHHFMMTPPATL